MSAIITDQIRILNAKNFVAGVSSSSNSYYTFVGLTEPTKIQATWNNTPPAPIDSFNDQNDYYVQFGAFKDKQKALKELSKLEKFISNIFIINLKQSLQIYLNYYLF